MLIKKRHKKFYPCSEWGVAMPFHLNLGLALFCNSLALLYFIDLQNMKMIRNRSFIALLLLGMLSMNFDLCCQIQKIPFLLSHFGEHKVLHGDSVFEFVVEDYIDHGSNNTSHDEESHENLPFHGNHTCSHAPIYFSLINDFSVVRSFNEKVEPATYYTFLFTSPVLGELFQPPRS